jgi:hypothetical protein
MEIDEEKLLREIRDLLKITDFKKVLYHKVEELKIRISIDPEQYFQQAESRNYKSSTPKEIKFELLLFGNEVWIPTISNIDISCAGYSPYDYIPAEIVYFISDFETDLELTQMWNNIYCNGKAFDLNFEKQSDILITGTLVERKITKERNFIQVDLKNKRKKKMEKVREIVTLMLKDEAYYNHIENEYDKIWQPYFNTVRESIK